MEDGLRVKVECKYCNIDSFFTMNKKVDQVHGVCVENDLLAYYSAS